MSEQEQWLAKKLVERVEKRLVVIRPLYCYNPECPLKYRPHTQDQHVPLK